MRHRLTTLLVIFFTFASQSAFADGLLYQLPEDGVYVVFDMKYESKIGKVTSVRNETMKMSSVGMVTENGKNCRWIELEWTRNRSPERKAADISRTKILVPEVYLKEGENAFNNKIRGWEQLREDGPVRELADKSNFGLKAYLCGPLSDVKKLEPLVVESKLGKLECDGVSGQIKSNAKPAKDRVRFKTRLHKKAPFGVVSSVMTIEMNNDGQFEEILTITFTLREVGKNAKSELPDAK